MSVPTAEPRNPDRLELVPPPAAELAGSLRPPRWILASDVANRIETSRYDAGILDDGYEAEHYLDESRSALAELAQLVPDFRTGLRQDVAGAVIRFVRRYPARHDQHTFGDPESTLLPVALVEPGSPLLEQTDDAPRCGTTACIAGWTTFAGALLGGMKPEDAEKLLHKHTDVADLEALIALGVLDPSRRTDAFLDWRNTWHAAPGQHVAPDDVGTLRARWLSTYVFMETTSNELAIQGFALFFDVDPYTGEPR